MLAEENRVIDHQSVRGWLQVEVAGDPVSGSRILKKTSQTPIHVGKPYFDEHGVLMQLMSPSAGLMDGDHFDIDAQVTGGGHLCLYTPTSAKVYSSVGGEGSSSTQFFQVSGENSFLEWSNEGTLLQGNSQYHQDVQINLKEGGEMLYYDSLIPGRIAKGESFEFEKFSSTFLANRDGLAFASERLCLEKNNLTFKAWEKAMAASSMVNIYLLSHRDASAYIEQIHDLQTDSKKCVLGATTLRGGGLLVRALVSSSIEWRKIQSQLRGIFSRLLDRPLLHFRNL